MTASTNTASLAQESLEEVARNWQPISTQDLFITDQVLASIINLARAHYVDKQDQFSKPLCKTLHTLLTTHCAKQRLLHIANGNVKHTAETIKDMQTYANEVVNAIPMQEQSDLQQEVTSLINWYILDNAPFATPADLLPLLKQPDTAPITDLLESFLPIASTPSAQQPLEFLLSLDWNQVFNACVRSGYSKGLGHTWSHCDINIQHLSSLLHANTLEELLEAEADTSSMHSKVSLKPAISFKTTAIMESMLKWEPIATEDLSEHAKVLASLINLERAHYVDGQPRLSTQIVDKLDILLQTHRDKMYLSYTVDNSVKRTDRILAAMPTYAQSVVNAIPMQEQSDLQKDLATLLNRHIIDEKAPFTCLREIAELLKTPDTDPITALLKSLRPLVANTPSLEEPLELLLSLNWDEVFSAFIKSGSSKEFNMIWSFGMRDIEVVSDLIRADNPEKLESVRSESRNVDFDFDLIPAIVCKKNMLTSQ